MPYGDQGSHQLGGIYAAGARPTPQEAYSWRLYSQAVIIAMGSILFGYDSAFIGTAIARRSFAASFVIHEDHAADISSNITSAFQAGELLGALLCFPRKGALQISVVVFLVGAALMVCATHQLSFIYVGRSLTGIACGAITATVPSYIAELSIVPIRGILTGFFEIAYQVGTLVGLWVNYGIDQHMDPDSATSWRLPMAVQLISAGILFVEAFFLDESPLWLMRNDQQEQATQVLERLRKLPRSHPYVAEELDMIRIRLSEEANFAKSVRPGVPSLCLWFVGAYVKAGRPADNIKAGKAPSPSTAAVGKAATAMIMVYSVFWSFGLNGIPWIVSAEIFHGALRTLTGTWAASIQWYGRKH
ncbi:hypothetical protein JDV02_008070 [Purpureocillium takamizusanense]|uniref:Major facilitator superfamily (MFS) profile domain-containing protein n=1 Tax=Purpureocillium takamizusanense TaxID=2060973 RepID=A0A9Q8QLE6_9HYPO|nr:uncharacterized protein JDV02_008070 [Purpureocillium takamizusanense]UNI22153.1 hypothetical protein JDV02_008070 [Purpureocillium takamizusanense]